MFLLRPWRQLRLHLRIGAAALVWILLWHSLVFRIYYYDGARERSAAPALAPVDIHSKCDFSEGLQDIFLVLRTGASEAATRLPAHFSTTLRCFSNESYSIWSDFEEDIGGYRIRNALDGIGPSIVATHPDFEYYNRLQEGGRASFTPEELAQWSATPSLATGRDTPGWKLDKWKFLPMAEKAFRLRPEAKWFVFMEDDTYIHWRNLLQWLSRIDATKPYYLGHETQSGDIIFAYGGAGFVISNPAMKALVQRRASNPGVYEDFTAGHWAGDCVLGKALLDAGVELSWQKPNLFGAGPFDMAYDETFDPSNHRLWCYYVTTYHHVTSSDIDEVFAAEQKWNEEVSIPSFFQPG